MSKWRIRVQGMRKRVFDRDRGVCAICGLDTEQLRRELADLDAPTRRARERELRWPAHRLDYWDADHIEPAAEQGPTSLDNLRTLCLLCHRTVTEQFMATRPRRRAARPAAPLMTGRAMPAKDGLWWYATKSQRIQCGRCGEDYDDCPAVMAYVPARDITGHYGVAHNGCWVSDGWVVWREHDACGWADWHDETATWTQMQQWAVGPWVQP